MKIFLLVILLLVAGCSEDKSNVEFQLQNSNSTASFRGLAVINDNVAWTTGSAGTVLRTIDGGAVWQNVSPKDYANIGFRDIHGWDENKAIIMGVGSPAIFLKTEDGGKSWQEVYRNELENIFFDSIEFWNDSCGISFSDPINGRHYIIKTEDYGNSWKQLDTSRIPMAIEGEAAFAASGTCITTIGDSLAWFVSGGVEARVFYTTDQGNFWQVSETPIISGLPTTGIYSVAFNDNYNGFIVGGDYTRDEELNANAAVSNDGGKTWTLLKSKPQGFKSCVEYIPHISGGVLTTGTSGTDLSYNNGVSWQQVDTTSFNTVSFSKNGTGWLVGDRGIISKIIVKKERLDGKN